MLAHPALAQAQDQLCAYRPEKNGNFGLGEYFGYGSILGLSDGNSSINNKVNFVGVGCPGRNQVRLGDTCNQGGTVGITKKGFYGTGEFNKNGDGGFTYSYRKILCPIGSPSNKNGTTRRAWAHSVTENLPALSNRPLIVGYSDDAGSLLKATIWVAPDFTYNNCHAPSSTPLFTGGASNHTFAVSVRKSIVGPNTYAYAAGFETNAPVSTDAQVASLTDPQLPLGSATYEHDTLLSGGSVLKAFAVKLQTSGTSSVSTVYSKYFPATFTLGGLTATTQKSSAASINTEGYAVGTVRFSVSGTNYTRLFVWDTETDKVVIPGWVSGGGASNRDSYGYAVNEWLVASAPADLLSLYGGPFPGQAFGALKGADGKLRAHAYVADGYTGSTVGRRDLFGFTWRSVQIDSSAPSVASAANSFGAAAGAKIVNTPILGEHPVAMLWRDGMPAVNLNTNTWPSGSTTFAKVVSLNRNQLMATRGNCVGPDVCYFLNTPTFFNAVELKGYAAGDVTEATMLSDNGRVVGNNLPAVGTGSFPAIWNNLPTADSQGCFATSSCLSVVPANTKAMQGSINDISIDGRYAVGTYNTMSAGRWDLNSGFAFTNLGGTGGLGAATKALSSGTAVGSRTVTVLGVPRQVASVRAALLTDLPLPAGALSSQSNAANEDGVIVGTVTFTGGLSKAYLWRIDPFVGYVGQFLPNPINADYGSEALGINNGQFAGTFCAVGYSLTSAASTAPRRATSWCGNNWTTLTASTDAHPSSDLTVTDSQLNHLNTVGQRIGHFRKPLEWQVTFGGGAYDQDIAYIHDPWDTNAANPIKDIRFMVGPDSELFLPTEGVAISSSHEILVRGIKANGQEGSFYLVPPKPAGGAFACIDNPPPPPPPPDPEDPPPPPEPPSGASGPAEILIGLVAIGLARRKKLAVSKK